MHVHAIEYYIAIAISCTGHKSIWKITLYGFSYFHVILSLIFRSIAVKFHAR